MGATARVVNLDGSEFIPQLIEGKAKLRKDGEVKRVANNRAEGISTATDPMTREEWLAGLAYLRNKVTEKEGKPSHQKQAGMWVLYWEMSMLCGGFRVEDCLNIRWSDIFDANGEYRKERGKVEQKTGKVKFFYNTPELISAVNDYVEAYGIDVTSGDYIFVNQRGSQLTRQAVWQKVKEVTNALGLDGHYGSHSMRKTYAMTTMNRLDETSDMTETEVRNFVQASLNHRDNGTTLRYLGIQRNNEHAQALAHAAWIMSGDTRSEEEILADKIVSEFEGLSAEMKSVVAERILQLI